MEGNPTASHKHEVSLVDFLQCPDEWLMRVAVGEVSELHVAISSQQRVLILSQNGRQDVAQRLAAEMRVSSQLARLLQDSVRIKADQLLAIAREEQLGSEGP